MREQWMTVTLGELCTMTKGLTPTQKAVPGKYPLVVTAAKFLTSSEYQFEGEAVCVPMVSSTGHGHASLKRVHYASGKFAVANIITALQAKPGADLDMRWLWLYLDHFRDDLIVSRMKGTANVSLAQKSLASVPVPLPPLTEQRRIVDLIGALDESIAAAEGMEARQADLFGQRLHELFSSGERTVTFDKIATFASGASFPVAAQGKTSGTIPFIKVSDMNLPGNETHIRSANNYVTKDGLKSLKGRVRPAGTVVFPKVGAALLTEKRRMLTCETAFDNNVMGAVPKDGVPPGYLFAFMRSIKLSPLSQSGALPSINQGHLRSLCLPDHSIKERQEISDEVQAHDDAAAEIAQLIDDLRGLRSNTLTALLSGVHEIPETYDNDIIEVAA